MNVCDCESYGRSHINSQAFGYDGVVVMYMWTSMYKYMRVCVYILQLYKVWEDDLELYCSPKNAKRENEVYKLEN